MRGDAGEIYTKCYLIESVCARVFLDSAAVQSCQSCIKYNRGTAASISTKGAAIIFVSECRPLLAISDVNFLPACFGLRGVVFIALEHTSKVLVKRRNVFQLNLPPGLRCSKDRRFQNHSLPACCPRNVVKPENLFEITRHTNCLLLVFRVMSNEAGCERSKTLRNTKSLFMFRFEFDTSGFFNFVWKHTCCSVYRKKQNDCGQETHSREFESDLARFAAAKDRVYPLRPLLWYAYFAFDPWLFEKTWISNGIRFFVLASPHKGNHFPQVASPTAHMSLYIENMLEKRDLDSFSVSALM